MPTAPRNPRPIGEGGSRDDTVDRLRTVPLQCAYSRMLSLLAQFYFFAGEVVRCSDRNRAYEITADNEAQFVGPVVCHGDVADEDAMIALNATSSRGCEKGDWCYRVDKNGTRWTCWEGNGTTSDQWRQDTPASVTDSVVQYLPMANGDPANPGFIFNSLGEPILVRINTADIA